MGVDPWQYWSAAQIASASECPLGNVQENWPLIVDELADCLIYTPNVCIGVIGTTAIEGASTFAPVKEGCYLGEPEPAETHRKTLPYYPYFGRGHIQLTHATNYDRYGQKIGMLWDQPALPLVESPDLALDPSAAAAIIALWFRDTRALPSVSYPEGYTLVQACEEQDWEWVRRLVYGGSDAAGSQRIAQIQADLGPPGGAVVPPAPQLPTYDWSYPSIAQNDQWSCAPTSIRWSLSSWGRNPSESWLENSMLSEGVVSVDEGLRLASGVELAAWVTRHYQEFGYQGDSDPLVSFDDVAAEVVTHKHPVCIGGRGWYHWTGVRGIADGRLLLANPAPGWKGVSQSLTREQFEYLGSFSLVRVQHPAAEAGVPVPPVTPEDPFAPWAGQVGSGLIQLMAEDNTLPAQRRSTWLPLGAPSPADVEECYGANGTRYYWLMTTGHGYRQRPA